MGEEIFQLLDCYRKVEWKEFESKYFVTIDPGKNYIFCCTVLKDIDIFKQ